MAPLLLLIIAACLAACAWRDLAVRRIPNTLSAIVAAAGLALRGLEGFGALGASLAAAALLFAVLFGLFASGALGGGDVKLATAIAIGLPPAGVWEFVVLTTLAGGMLSALYLVAIRLRLERRAPKGRRYLMLRRVIAVERWRCNRRGPLPYGIAICASSFALASATLFVG